MSLPTPDGACIRLYGEEVTHNPQSGGSDTVKVIRHSPEPGQEQNPLAILFGTMAESQFRVEPTRGDVVVLDGDNYRVYDVKKDRPGGDALTAGLWLHLDQVEA